MRCHKSGICGNYPGKCRECWSTSDIVNNYPYFTKRDLIEFKIFWGNHTSVSADVKLNQWLAENPSVELVEWQYQQARLGDHSICITYKDKEKENG